MSPLDRVFDIAATIIGKDPVRFIQRRLGIPSPYQQMLAEFEHTTELKAAARALRRAGYRQFDAHTPYPVHGMDEAMGLRRSLMPFIVLGGSIVGCLGGYYLQYWINAVNYPLVISGKPFASIPAFIPVTFELTVLLSAFAAVFGMLFVNGLPELYSPLFKSERFKRHSIDRFFISIDGGDPKYDARAARELLEQSGSKFVEVVEP